MPSLRDLCAAVVHLNSLLFGISCSWLSQPSARWMIWHLVLEQEDHVFVDGYHRHAALKAMKIPRTRVYWGSLPVEQGNLHTLEQVTARLKTKDTQNFPRCQSGE